ncbi:MAG: GNAT family N-acetyltransferase [Sulfitobacter sp.]|nr:GNAT family N-acetyltransferase [Sulfitobacter sp.]
MPRIHTRAEDLAHAGALIARGWVTVAETDSGVAGFAARNGKDLDALYVSAAMRGQGVGSKLLSHIKKDSEVIELWTFQANKPAQGFYMKHGFKELGRTDGADNDERLPDIRFQWKREAA